MKYSIAKRLAFVFVATFGLGTLLAFAIQAGLPKIEREPWKQPPTQPDAGPVERPCDELAVGGMLPCKRGPKPCSEARP